MGPKDASHGLSSNRLLAALPAPEYERIALRLERVSLAIKQVLYEQGAPITRVYFPESGVVSLVIEMNDQLSAEVGLIGREGMVGTPAFLGAERSPTRAFCQLKGDVLAMEADVLLHEARQNGRLDSLLRRYTQALFGQISQSTACNHLHPIEERLARWLLMCHDRMDSDSIALTQEFVAQMLGVRRPTVTVVVGLLQQAGLIETSRGVIRIVDRKGLEQASCECYAVVRRQFEQLLSDVPMDPRD
jgi:CRP-like cAMP-binding protein